MLSAVDDDQRALDREARLRERNARRRARGREAWDGAVFSWDDATAARASRRPAEPDAATPAAPGPGGAPRPRLAR